MSDAHLFTEASRLAYADRAKYLGDPAFVRCAGRGPDRQGLYRQPRRADRSGQGHGHGARPAIRRRSMPNYAPQVSPVLHGTSHMTIVDDSGEVVAMTTSVESVFGAEIMAKGFMLNNTLTDFSFQPVRDGKPVANAPAPGKLPLSAMSPTIVFDKDGNFLVSVGSPGGPAIIDYVAQILIGMLDAKMTPKDAIAMPHEINMNGATLLEKSPGSDALAAQLTAMGHTVQVPQVERQRPARHRKGQRRLYRRRRPPPGRDCLGGLEAEEPRHPLSRWLYAVASRVLKYYFNKPRSLTGRGGPPKNRALFGPQRAFRSLETHEAHLSAEQTRAQAPPWLPLAHGHGRRPQGSDPPPRPRPQEALGLNARRTSRARQAHAS